jgi:hypothetical protein
VEVETQASVDNAAIGAMCYFKSDSRARDMIDTPWIWWGWTCGVTVRTGRETLNVSTCRLLFDRLRLSL